MDIVLGFLAPGQIRLTDSAPINMVLKDVSLPSPKRQDS